MLYGTRQKFEGLKVLLSFAAIATGIMLSNVAASSSMYLGNGAVDVVGVWQWVMQGEEATTDASGPMFEIRRTANGKLKAMLVARSGDAVHGANVSVDEGQVCVTTEGGARFSGELSDDGLRIHGVLKYGGESASAMLERVVHRKLRRAAGRRAYAT